MKGVPAKASSERRNLDRALAYAEAEVFTVAIRHARDHRDAGCAICVAVGAHLAALAAWGSGTGRNDKRSKPSPRLSEIARRAP